jgi:hypothetical protein
MVKSVAIKVPLAHPVKQLLKTLPKTLAAPHLAQSRFFKWLKQVSLGSNL